MSDASPPLSSTANDNVPYHPMALDDVSPGFWGRIDAWSEQATTWLNPILIKEARQAIKSRQFTITYFLLLFAALSWTIAGVVLNSPDIYYLPTGQSMMMGYYLVLALPMIAIVPLAAHRSLAAELDDGTFEMLSITRLRAMGIVMGKLNSAVLQMFMYLATLVPCLAFTYLLRGIDIVSISIILFVIFLTTFVLTTFGLLLGAIAVNRAFQLLALLVLLAAIVIAEFMCGAICLDGVLQADFVSDQDAQTASLSFVVTCIGFCVLFVKAAAAGIAPMTENKSTGLRRWMIVQQILWVVCMTACCIGFNDYEPGLFGVVALAGYWFVCGVFMMAESAELSPRVQRTLPQSGFARMMLTWFNPGPGTGYVFAITSGAAGIFTLASVALFYGIDDSDRLISSGLAMIGYLIFYLSVVRLLILAASRFAPPSIALNLLVAILVMIGGMLLPACIDVLFTGSISNAYHIGHLTNWFWTLEEIDRNRANIAISFIILLIGGAFFILNLILLARELSYRKIAVPERIRRVEQQATVAEANLPHPLDA